MPSLQSRILLAITAAVFLAAVLSLRTFSDAELARAKLVDAPRSIAGRAVHVDTDSGLATRLLKTPFAFIASVDVPERAKVTVSVDGRTVCERDVRAGASRLDCAVSGGWNPAAIHVVSIESTAMPWTLTSLELATHHGHTTGSNYALVLPAGATPFTRPSVLLVLFVALAVGCGVAMPWPQLPRAARWIHRVLAAAIGLLLATVLLSSLVSPYLVVLSLGTVVRWLLLLFLPWLWALAAWLMASPRSREEVLSSWARPATVAAIVVAVASAVVASRVNEYYDGNVSGLLSIARKTFEENPLFAGRADVRASIVLKESGYDGQFMYFAMFDPLLRRFSDRPGEYRRVMDAPPYRYGRIGFPLMALVLSGGDWTRFPIAMTVLVLFGMGAFALLLARMAQDFGVTPAMGGLTLLIPAFWQSIQTGLPEPVAAALLLAGILCVSRGAWLWAAVLFAASLLTRETGIVAVACVLGVHARREPRAVAVFLAASAVVLAWRSYVAWTLYPDWGIEGLLFHPPDLGLPFRGIADLWREVNHGRYYPETAAMARSAIALPLLLTAGLALAAALAVALPHPWHFAAVAYGAVAVSLNFKQIWVHVANAQRGVFELFVMLALSAVLANRYPPILRRAAWAFWTLSFAYVFFLGFDAGYLRSALFPF